MARFNESIEPMTLGNMRENGVRSLAIQWPQCQHEAIMTPSGPDWVHEIKRDGYRPIVRGEAPPFGYSRAADGLAAFEAGRQPFLPLWATQCSIRNFPAHSRHPYLCGRGLGEVLA
jgi:hypothetical protein